MARPKGRKSSPFAKHGGPPTPITRETMTTDQILAAKREILALIDLGSAVNLRDACDQLSISPVRAHKWLSQDPDFKAEYEAHLQAVADLIEKTLLDSKNVIALMFLLKKLRPEYRDNHRPEISTADTRKLLSQLIELGAQKRLAPPKVTIIESTATEIEPAATKIEECV